MPAVAHVYGMGMDVCFAPVRKTLALMDKSGSNSCQCRRHLLSMWCMWCLKEGQRDDSDRAVHPLIVTYVTFVFQEGQCKGEG